MKIKTRKAIAKRFRITKTKKVLHRRAGQDHYNIGEPGKVTRQKRKGKKLLPSNKKKLIRAMPYG